MAFSPPAVKRDLPPKLSYSNAWDKVSAIGEYADGVQAAQSPGPGGLLQLLTSADSQHVRGSRAGRGGCHLAPSNGGKRRARSGERQNAGRRGGSNSGALGMEMGDYVGSGSGEGEDSHDGDDESSYGELSDGDEPGGNGRPGPNGGYGLEGGVDAQGQPVTVGGALGLTDEQFPEVLNVEQAPGRNGREGQYGSVGRRRAESRGYMRKAEATIKAQVTASPRSPRHHALRGGTWTERQQQGPAA